MQGKPADEDFYNRLMSLEVEENSDMPGAIQIRLPVARSKNGDLTSVTDPG
jgi:hypothetical protein